MKITEIHEAIQNALIDKKFKGDFEVTIYHPNMEAIKIAGDLYLAGDFHRNLKYEIKNICFQIVSGIITDGNFTFDIKGQVEYLYTSGMEVEE